MSKLYTLKIKITCERYGMNLRVNYPSVVTRTTRLGNNVNFNGIDIVGAGRVTIGDNFHSGNGILIISQIHRYDDGNAIPYDSDEVIPKDVIIEDNVWLGSRVIILGGNKIGEGAIIQAGSVVVSDIPSLAIAGGHPAKIFRYRDAEHYYKMKAEGRFH